MDDSVAKDAKRLLLANATAEDCAVLNAHDPEVSGWGSGYPGRVIRYGLGGDPDPSAPDALWSDGARFFARLEGAPAVCWLEEVASLPLPARTVYPDGREQLELESDIG